MEGTTPEDDGKPDEATTGCVEMEGWTELRTVSTGRFTPSVVTVRRKALPLKEERGGKRWKGPSPPFRSAS